MTEIMRSINEQEYSLREESLRLFKNSVSLRELLHQIFCERDYNLLFEILQCWSRNFRTDDY